MKSSTVISVLVALILASGSSFAGQGQGGNASSNQARQVDHDRDYDRSYERDYNRSYDRDHLQNPASLKDQDIYGNELMSDAERLQYRNELGNSTTQKSQMKLQAQHEQAMQERALQQGQDLVPPGQGPVYGGELMSVQERNKYREELRLIDSDQEREEFQAQHRDHVNQRAQALGLEVEEAE